MKGDKEGLNGCTELSRWREGNVQSPDTEGAWCMERHSSRMAQNKAGEVAGIKFLRASWTELDS